MNGPGQGGASPCGLVDDMRESAISGITGELKKALVPHEDCLGVFGILFYTAAAGSIIGSFLLPYGSLSRLSAATVGFLFALGAWTALRMPYSAVIKGWFSEKYQFGSLLGFGAGISIILILILVVGGA